jgi:hypothetical protein
MTWSIIRVGGGTVTLPKGVNTISDSSECADEEHGSDGGTVTLISRYSNPRFLTLEGEIYGKGTAGSVLISTYLTPLRAMNRYDVTISDPDNQCGGTWLFKSYSFTRDKEDTVEAKYNFSLTFKQGIAVIINS